MSRKVLGLYVGDSELTLSELALSPFGTVEVSTQTLPCEHDDLPGAIDQLLRPHRQGKKPRPLKIAVGLPAMRVFFATRPTVSSDRDASPALLLHGVIRSSDLNPEDMEVDLLRGQPGKKPLTSLAACRRKYINWLVGIFSELGVRPYRVEPAPFALLRVAAKELKPPRKVTTVIRVFLAERQGVALLMQGSMPLACRSFELPPGEEASAIRSMAFAMRVVGRHSGDGASPEALLVHGRTDLREALQGDEVAGFLGYPVLHVESPSYTPEFIARGLAMGCREDELAFDLSRNLKERPPLVEVIPFGQIAAQTAVLASLTWMLSGHLRDTRQAYDMVHRECAGHTWMAKVADDALTKEKADLEQKVTTVKGYLDTRVLWSTYTREAASLLPDNMVLRSFDAMGELPGGKNSKGPKKLLQLGLSAPIPQGLKMPKEIDNYLDALRSNKTIKREFPQVGLGSLRWAEAKAGSAPQANFTVDCMPGAAPPTIKVVPAPKPK